MRYFLLAFMLMISCKFVFGGTTEPVVSEKPETSNSDNMFNESDLRTRIKNLNIPFTPKYSRDLKRKIDDYIKNYRKKTGRVLGLSSIYFPVIEQYLKANDIPDAFKYLPVIETDLNPRAVSPDGAVGIWQFMPTTGAIYGLVSDLYVDQRCDIHRSTEAASKYLKKLYDIYGDWALVLAAYNAGPGRVNSAIKKAFSNNYWAIEKYLPQQTRDYIPKFIATAYAMQYFPEYEIIADNPDLDLQLTKEMKVYKDISFEEVGLITGLSLEQVQILNPQYVKNFIPASSDGNFITLPKRIINAFNHFLSLPDYRKNDYLKAAPIVNAERGDNNNSFYHKMIIGTDESESLENIAEKYDLSVHSLIVWNNLTELTFKPGSELIVYLPKKVESKVMEIPLFKKLKSLKASKQKLDLYDFESLDLDRNPLRKYTLTPYLSYVLLPNESLNDVAIKYGVDLSSLVKLNHFSDDWLPKPGMLIRVKELETIKP